MKLSLIQHAVILGGIVLVLWAVEVLDRMVFAGALDLYGISPRTWVGLRNIAISPFLHAGFGHLFANTLPLVVLGWLVMLRNTRDFFVVTFIAAVISGLGIWLFGASNTVHIGVSGVIFGYLGYLLWRGYLERSVVAIVLAVMALFFYGGMLWGVLPGREGVSWLGHLFGFAGGMVAAYVVTERRPALTDLRVRQRSDVPYS
ncbi:MAG: rhomboid family intramembrane serine protease [Caldilineaceae bacterium]|nr:rhomboid family intramembrane serine protease [Caldilineaceae bacterium]